MHTPNTDKLLALIPKFPKRLEFDYLSDDQRTLIGAVFNLLLRAQPEIENLKLNAFAVHPGPVTADIAKIIHGETAPNNLNQPTTSLKVGGGAPGINLPTTAGPGDVGAREIVFVKPIQPQKP